RNGHVGRFRCPGQIQPVSYVAQSRATRRVHLETLPHKAVEGLANGGRHKGLAGLFVLNRRLLGESFDNNAPQRPHVSGGGGIVGGAFRRRGGGRGRGR